jgi:hypothetical protein
MRLHESSYFKKHHHIDLGISYWYTDREVVVFMENRKFLLAVEVGLGSWMISVICAIFWGESQPCLAWFSSLLNLSKIRGVFPLKCRLELVSGVNKGRFPVMQRNIPRFHVFRVNRGNLSAYLSYFSMLFTR